MDANANWKYGEDLHQRIADVLGWPVKDTHSFNLHMLREMVRDKDPKLTKEISDYIQSGRHVYGEPLKRKHRIDYG